MISSAVVVPSLETNDGQLLKRKASQSIYDDRKRPKVDTFDTLNYDDARQSSETAQRVSVVKSTSNSAEEKKRSQRLFGGILGVVSQKTSTNSTHRRRDEIEARARERAKKDAEESAAQKQRRKDELLKGRKVKQAQWEKKALSVRHASMRARACYLKTKTEPVLYFKPWDLRPEDEDVIEEQKSQAEEQINAELQQSSTEDTPVSPVSKAADTVPQVLEPQTDSTKPLDVEIIEKSPTQILEIVSSTVVGNDFGTPKVEIDAGGPDEDDQVDGELVKGVKEDDDVIY